MHNLRATTLAEVNHFVIKQYKSFVTSPIGTAVYGLGLMVCLDVFCLLLLPQQHASGLPLTF
jgi:hypothetical protein